MLQLSENKKLFREDTENIELLAVYRLGIPEDSTGRCGNELEQGQGERDRKRWRGHFTSKIILDGDEYTQRLETS